MAAFASLLISSSSFNGLGEDKWARIGLTHDSKTGIAYPSAHARKDKSVEEVTCSTAVRAENRESVSRDWSSRDCRVVAGSLGLDISVCLFVDSLGVDIDGERSIY